MILMICNDTAESGVELCLKQPRHSQTVIVSGPYDEQQCYCAIILSRSGRAASNSFQLLVQTCLDPTVANIESESQHDLHYCYRV